MIILRGKPFQFSISATFRYFGIPYVGNQARFQYNGFDSYIKFTPLNNNLLIYISILEVVLDK